MDPLSHAVVGRAIVVMLDRRERFGRGSGAAATLGALAPDADAALAPFGWDVYLRAHEIGTHSMAGALVMACATAALVRAPGSSAQKDLAAPGCSGPISGSAPLGDQGHETSRVTSGSARYLDPMDARSRRR